MKCQNLLMKEKFYFYFRLLEGGKPFYLTSCKKTFVKVEKYFSPSKEIQIREKCFFTGEITQHLNCLSYASYQKAPYPLWIGTHNNLMIQSKKYLTWKTHKCCVLRFETVGISDHKTLRLLYSKMSPVHIYKLTLMNSNLQPSQVGPHWKEVHSLLKCTRTDRRSLIISMAVYVHLRERCAPWSGTDFCHVKLVWPLLIPSSYLPALCFLPYDGEKKRKKGTLFWQNNPQEKEINYTKQLFGYGLSLHDSCNHSIWYRQFLCCRGLQSSFQILCTMLGWFL